MNVFNKFTVRSLKKNRSRTLVTIIGIALSMALITAIIQAANSGLNYLVRGETQRVGAFHGYYYNITEDLAKKVQSDPEVSDTALWQQVGWAEIDSTNESKPYLLIESISDNFTDLVSVNLTSGRMPQKDYEIILPSHLSSNGGVTHKLGDIVTLNVGKRMDNGHELTGPYTGEGEITDSTEKKYTVVGFYERLDYSIEDYESPGYTAFTTGGGTGSCYLFFKVQNPRDYFDYVNKSTIDANYRSHSDLLAYSGSLKDSSLSQALYGFAAILILLISFGSILLIYNSFSISVSERTKQFGILKSVGATKKQIMRTVFFEALVLCAVAIPLGMIVGCAGIGITLYLLKDSFSVFLYSGADIKMHLVINVWGLVICSAVCLITTLISAYIPARKAIKISPIDAIRQNKDVKIRRKDIRFKKIIYKLFGFEGMLAAKNFARNKKRYRSTVISLFLSVTLFISASSFCAYLTDSVNTVSGTGHSDTDISYYTNKNTVSNPDQFLSSLSSVNEVESGVYYSQSYFDAVFDSSVISDKYKDMFDTQLNGNSFNESCQVLFLNDEAFNKLCENNSLDKTKFYDKTNLQAVVFDEINTIVRTDDTHSKRINNNILKSDKFPISINITMEKEIDGYTLWGTKDDENSNTCHYYYYPQEYLDSFGNDTISESDLDTSKAKILTDEQAMNKMKLTIGAKAENYPYYLPKASGIYIVYPHSLMDSVLNEQFNDYFSSYYFDFKAPNHSEAYKNIEQILSSNGLSNESLYNLAESDESQRTMVTIVNVFAYGFIILISLIAMANVFNSISTSISLRRREFAMLKSVGLTKRSFSKMMNFECIIYGIKGLFFGLIASLLVTYAIYKASDAAVEKSFYVPWYSVAIAVLSVFIVVFATMLYATGKIKKDNPIDALKNENL